jgi:hypothetical protein
MTGGVVVTVLYTDTEPGGTRTVVTPTSTGCMGGPGQLVTDTISGIIGKITGNL